MRYFSLVNNMGVFGTLGVHIKLIPTVRYLIIYSCKATNYQPKLIENTSTSQAFPQKKRQKTKIKFSKIEKRKIQ
jgi:hypothetical protein